MPAAATAGPAIRVTVTGAAGRLAYALLFRIASGELLGPNQPVRLVLFDLPLARKAMQGVAMELEDCAFPLLRGIVATDDPAVAFDGTQLAFLVGARPAAEGVGRRDVDADNARIHAVHGAVLGRLAAPDCKVLVVGNPCNVNAWVAVQAAQRAGRIAPRRFTALMRLEHNRALAELSRRNGRPVAEIAAQGRVAVWGHSWSSIHAAVAPDGGAAAAATLVATVGSDGSAATVDVGIADRPAAIAAARGRHAEASAASAAIDQMRDWCLGTEGRWTTMGVASEGGYGIPAGLFFGVPVTAADGDYRIVEGLRLDAAARAAIAAGVREVEAALRAVESVVQAAVPSN